MSDIAYKVNQTESRKLYSLAKELAESGDNRLKAEIDKICDRNQLEMNQADMLRKEFLVSEQDKAYCLETQCGDFGETVTFKFDKHLVDKYGISQLIAGLRAEFENWKLQKILTDESVIRDLERKISMVEKGDNYD